MTEGKTIENPVSKNEESAMEYAFNAFKEPVRKIGENLAENAKVFLSEIFKNKK